MFVAETRELLMLLFICNMEALIIHLSQLIEPMATEHLSGQYYVRDTV